MTTTDRRLDAASRRAETLDQLRAQLRAQAYEEAAGPIIGLIDRVLDRLAAKFDWSSDDLAAAKAVLVEELEAMPPTIEPDQQAAQ